MQFALTACSKEQELDQNMKMHAGTEYMEPAFILLKSDGFLQLALHCMNWSTETLVVRIPALEEFVLRVNSAEPDKEAGSKTN